jgi:hypothetical protein
VSPCKGIPELKYDVCTYYPVENGQPARVRGIVHTLTVCVYLLESTVHVNFTFYRVAPGQQHGVGVDATVPIGMQLCRISSTVLHVEGVAAGKGFLLPPIATLSRQIDQQSRFSERMWG